MMISHYRRPFITSNKGNQQYIRVLSASRCFWKLCVNSANKETHAPWSHSLFIKLYAYSRRFVDFV